MTRGGNRNGFTLIELAIVLSIVGLIIGSIWLTAASVLNNYKKDELNKGVLQIVQRTKKLFPNAAAASLSNRGQFTTATAIAAGIFPGNWVNTATGIVTNPFSVGASGVLVACECDATMPNSVEIRLFPLPTDACISLAAALVGSSAHEPYIQRIINYANGYTIGQPFGRVPLAAATMSNIVALCSSPPTAAGDLRIDIPVP